MYRPGEPEDETQISILLCILFAISAIVAKGLVKMIFV